MLEKIEDVVFSGEKLYHRHKIRFFEKKDFKNICIYFKSGNSFYVDYMLDYVEINSSFDFDLFKNLLCSDKITDEVLSQLIMLFNNYEGNFNQNVLYEIILNIKSKSITEEMYFG